MKRFEDITDLRRELLRRLDAHPFRSWSAALLRDVTAVLDEHADPAPIPGRPVKLTVVR